jgi:hypothetical protein
MTSRAHIERLEFARQLGLQAEVGMHACMVPQCLLLLQAGAQSKLLRRHSRFYCLLALPTNGRVCRWLDLPLG